MSWPHDAKTTRDLLREAADRLTARARRRPDTFTSAVTCERVVASFDWHDVVRVTRYCDGVLLARSKPGRPHELEAVLYVA